MLFIAEYKEEAPVLLDAASDEHAVRMLEAHGLGMPERLHEVEPGTLLLELSVADENRIEGDDNPANHSATGLAFEPLDATAEWLDAWLTRTQAAHAATEPPEEEVDHGGE